MAANSNLDLTDPDILEALSNVHAAAVRIVALSSGRFAIFSRGVQLHGIFDSLREDVIRECCAEEMRDWEASMSAEREHRGTAVPMGPGADKPEDIGL